jgi:hypothetical protein
MSNPPSRHSQRARRLLGGVAVAAASFGLPAVAHAIGDPVPGPGTSCWKEYEFYRSGNVLTATAFKDCTHLSVAQPLPVAVQIWYSDPYWSGWLTAASGTGVAMTSPGYCDPSWPSTFRHSITHQEIRCP